MVNYTDINPKWTIAIDMYYKTIYILEQNIGDFL